MATAIRWLGAFGHGGTLAEALDWELGENKREVAAIFYDRRHRVDSEDDHIRRCQIGLLLQKGAILKGFHGDVWSIALDNGRLVPTRRSCESTWHTECFCKPLYRGIVCRKPLDQLRPATRRAVISAARQYNLPIYVNKWGEIYTPLPDKAWRR